MIERSARWTMHVGLAALLFGGSACIIQGSDDGDDGSGAAASDGDGDGDGAGAGSTAGGGSGAGTPGADGVGPGGDPMPEASSPGEHVCAGCPEAVIDTADADAGTATIFSISGKVAGQVGQGRFIVLRDNGQFAGGGIYVDPSTGDFAQTLPLFCGETLLKVFFSNEAGTSAYVQRITNSGCLEGDVRVTVAWDETTNFWGTHLIRFGGTINDDFADCYSSFYCAPDSAYNDWGVAEDQTDDPIQDLDVHTDVMGVENIYYPGAEDGLTVMVENLDELGGLTPAGTLYINVHDQPTYVKQIGKLSPKEVLIAASVDGTAGTMEIIDEIYPCAADWLSACEADIP